MRVVGCILECDGKILMLRRLNHKPEGGTLALPGGKVEKDESDLRAIMREVWEETGYQAREDELQNLGEYEFFTSLGEPYKYIVFKIKLDARPKITLEESAHSEITWLSPKEFFNRSDLIKDLNNLLKMIGY